MKIELKKETNIKGEIFYCIYVNGKYENLSMDEVEARKIFENTKAGYQRTYEVLETCEI